MARFLSNCGNLMRRTALWRKSLRKSSSVIVDISAAVICCSRLLIANSGTSLFSALALCGQHCWQVSHPYMRLPTFLPTHSGSSPLFSISMHDRHRVASTAAPPCNAPAGHACSHRLQSPPLSSHCSSGGNSSVVTNSPRK